MTKIVDLDHGKKPVVNHPRHYNRGKVEAIDFIESVGHGDGFAIGNAIKYLIRYDAKDDRESNLKKAFWYLDRVAKKRVGEDRRPFRASSWIDYVAEVYPYLPRQVAECIALAAFDRRITAARDCLLNFLEVEGIAPEVDQ